MEKQRTVLPIKMACGFQRKVGKYEQIQKTIAKILLHPAVADNDDRHGVAHRGVYS